MALDEPSGFRGGEIKKLQAVAIKLQQKLATAVTMLALAP